MFATLLRIFYQEFKKKKKILPVTGIEKKIQKLAMSGMCKTKDTRTWTNVKDITGLEKEQKKGDNLKKGHSRDELLRDLAFK
ncbi:hypothetical protein Bpfe_008207, partial [Biomphalaria pfeifferi]